LTDKHQKQTIQTVSMYPSAKPNFNSNYEKCNQIWSPDYTLKST